MKIFVQVINTQTGLSMSGMIEEPVKTGLEIDNALKHFGVEEREIKWRSSFVENDIIHTPCLMQGTVPGTSKIVNVVAYE